MDSFKITKGDGGRKSSTNTSLAMRFNAEEESIEELLKPTNELLSSPQQSLEDFSWRSLQGNLFSRNRSGSIEGISSGSSGSHNIISDVSSSDTNTIGTWKLIKGKVSQAMEDIKSSKGVQITPSKSEATCNHSDQEASSINISVSDELPLLSEQHHTSTILPKVKLSSFVTESDSDIDIEPNDDIQFPPSSFRKSLASLRSRSCIKSKVGSLKHKSQSQQQFGSEQQLHYSHHLKKKNHSLKKDESPSQFSSSFPLTEVESFLKMRPKQRSNSDLNSQKKYEIESGIEVVEDMVISNGNLDADSQINLELFNENGSDSSKKAGDDDDNVLGMSIVEELITFRHRSKTDSNLINVDMRKAQQPSENLLSMHQQKREQIQHQPQHISLINKLNLIWTNKSKNFSAVAIIVLLISVLILPLPDFFCGVLSCLFTISLFSFITDYCKTLITHNTQNSIGFKSIEYNFSTSSTFDGKFKCADNQVCEILPVEEHLSLKSYSGWMNEINNYDPTNHHLSMTTPVFVRLSGFTLALSSTSFRIPRRAMWNEQIIDKDNVIFTQTRYFNLSGCRVEMCPKGLARKRHFNRKYPIQLIIKNSNASEENHLKLKKSSQDNSEQQQQQQDHREPETFNKYEEQYKKQGSCQHTLDIDDGGAGSCITGSYINELKRQSLNESNEDMFIDSNLDNSGGSFDFGNTVSNSDFQKLQNKHEILSKEEVPCGDETRLLLFARCDREKEDWYRRFSAASRGQTCDRQEHIPNIVMFSEEEIANAIKATSASNDCGENSPTSDEKTLKSKLCSDTTTERSSDKNKTKRKISIQDHSYEGVLISPCALRNLPDYIKFMAKYQSRYSTSTTNINVPSTDKNSKRDRQQKSKEDELWKGIDQTSFKQQSENVVWFNILIGRVLYNVFNNKELLDRIQEFLQRKLSAIRLPSFMEDIVIGELDLGDTPPLIHRVSQPLLDERGTWIDADVSYEGLMHMTITTKLNLLRLKRQQHHEFNDSTVPTTVNSSIDSVNSTVTHLITNNNTNINNFPLKTTNSNNVLRKSNTNASITNCAIYDSNAESSGASSSESETQTLGAINPSSEPHSSFYTPPGSSRRFLRIVDRITASNLFQSATEISYIQRAMENMSTKITLKVELKGLVSKVVVNLPPPPSDRIWLAFRGPPRLWISAKPTVGDHSFDWSIVTTIIENKLCDEVYKYLVYPNMVDIIVPILGEPTYKESN